MDSKATEILIVDDVPNNISVIAGHLDSHGYELVMATSGEAALNSLEESLPDLILLDISMPGMDGLEVCRELKQRRETREIPVIFLTARGTAEDIVKGFTAGGVDYVTKPFHQAELKARINTHLELSRLRKDLQAKNALLERAAVTDPLTQLMNRRGMMEQLKREYSRICRGGSPAVLLMVDVDNFKEVNDSRGHDCGDHVLVETAGLMAKGIRKQDSLCRWGGEEFLFLLPETSLKDGVEVAQKIRQAIADQELTYKDSPLRRTVTLGASILDTSIDIDHGLTLADQALYRGKESGKNRVEQAQ